MQNKGLDALDKRLLSELMANARLPYTDLADKLGVTVPTVRDRLERLLNEGVATLEVIPHPAKLGFQTSAYVGLRIRLDKTDWVLKKLEAKQNVVYLALTGGRYNAIALVLFESPTHLANFLDHQLLPIDGVERTETLIDLKVLKRGWAESLYSLHLQRSLDQLDRRIIAALQGSVRISFSALAENVNASVPTVRQRLHRMLSEGVISLSALYNPLKLGYGAVAHIGLQVHPSKMQQVQQQLLPMKNIQYMVMSAGRYDIVLWAFFESQEEFADFMHVELAKVDGILRAEPLANLKVLKRTYRGLFGQAA